MIRIEFRSVSGVLVCVSTGEAVPVPAVGSLVTFEGSPTVAKVSQVLYHYEVRDIKVTCWLAPAADGS